MTRPEGERLARMEQRQDDMASDIADIKQMLKDRENKYITRAEAAVVGIVLTVLATGISIWVNIKDHIK